MAHDGSGGIENALLIVKVGKVQASLNAEVRIVQPRKAFPKCACAEGRPSLCSQMPKRASVWAKEGSRIEARCRWGEGGGVVVASKGDHEVGVRVRIVGVESENGFELLSGRFEITQQEMLRPGEDVAAPRERPEGLRAEAECSARRVEQGVLTG